MTPSRADKIMHQMGFPDSETGPYVAELRKVIEREVAGGLASHSYGTWAADNLTHEERARALLEFHWAIERGHFHRVECLDGFSLRRLRPWLGDRAREGAMLFRLWRDRYLLRRQNPYRRESGA